ncbi:MAG: glycosyltransferase family 2 protein [Limnochordaceae bacterium]|nr:glycosyltransferase family 2 protein [Limnochordaceae bacterium]
MTFGIKDIGAAIVTYNTRQLLVDLVRSLVEPGSLPMAERGQAVRHASWPLPSRRSPAMAQEQIFVVDNASTDGTDQSIKRAFPRIGYVYNHSNLGPATAFNQAVRRAAAYRLILVSNSDIWVPPSTLRIMTDYLNEDRDCMGVCGRLCHPDGTPQPSRTAVTSLLPADMSRVHRATFPGTTFALYRREAFERVGLYDEVFYFYNEDLDWAIRAQRLGLRFMYLPEARVVHYVSQGRKQNGPKIIAHLYRSNLYVYRRHWPRLVRLAYGLMLAEIEWRRHRAEWDYRRRRSPYDAPTRSGTDRQVVQAVWEEARQQLMAELRTPSTPKIPTLAGFAADRDIVRATPSDLD